MGAFRFKKERHASGRITPILQWKRQPCWISFLWPTRHRWNTTEGSMCMEPMTPSNWTVWEKTAKTHTNTSHSLVMLSTDDMVNWTYHGLIDVKALSPWGIASWAPSIVSRVESDGKTYAGEPVHPRIRPLQGSFRPGCRDR